MAVVTCIVVTAGPRLEVHSSNKKYIAKLEKQYEKENASNYCEKPKYIKQTLNNPAGNPLPGTPSINSIYNNECDLKIKDIKKDTKLTNTLITTNNRENKFLSRQFYNVPDILDCNYYEKLNNIKPILKEAFLEKKNYSSELLKNN